MVVKFDIFQNVKNFFCKKYHQIGLQSAKLYARSGNFVFWGGITWEIVPHILTAVDLDSYYNICVALPLSQKGTPAVPNKRRRLVLRMDSELAPVLSKIKALLVVAL